MGSLKLRYRGNRVITLSPSSFSYESTEFRKPDGTLPTDDDPIRALFQYTLSETFRQSDLFGGSGGSYFNDLAVLPLAKITQIVLRGGIRLNAVSIVLSSGQTLTHGGTGGTATSLSLDSTEHIVKLRLCGSRF